MLRFELNIVIVCECVNMKENFNVSTEGEVDLCESK